MTSFETEDEVLIQLISLEPLFHRFEHLRGRTPTRSDFEAMTSPDFFEIGASGRLYSREFILQTLETRYSNQLPHPDLWSTRDFQLLPLGPGTWLLHYLLEQTLPEGQRLTRRTTIWRQQPEGWQTLFHQGTVVESPHSGAPSSAQSA